MNENTVIITEKDGRYQIQNNGIPEFALIGILECVVFDLKTAERKSLDTQQEKTAANLPEIGQEPSEIGEQSKEESSEIKKETNQSPAAPDLRTRINNAIKAIRALGGEIENTELNNLTQEELQLELEELTDQYKRLKSSKTKR